MEPAVDTAGTAVGPADPAVGPADPAVGPADTADTAVGPAVEMDSVAKVSVEDSVAKVSVEDSVAKVKVKAERGVSGDITRQGNSLTINVLRFYLNKGSYIIIFSSRRYTLSWIFDTAPMPF